MKLIIDIGNTCTKLAAFDGREVAEECRTQNGDWKALERFCAKHRFEAGICSSVVTLDDEYAEHLNSLPFHFIIFRSGITPIPIVNRYATPLTLGSDRLAAAVGAYAKSKGKEILIIDAGTCITYDYVNAQGEYLGGNISPGPAMRLEALHSYTSKLPLVSIDGETPPIGDTTETAIRSGVMKGLETEINGYISDFVQNTENPIVYLTGGIHINNLPNSEKLCIFADSFLVPEGLNCILEYNQKLQSQKTNNSTK